MSSSILGKFPEIRLRRTRRTKGLRRLIAETKLSSSDLIYPVFILEGKDKVEPVESMPGISRKTIDQLLKELTKVSDLEIPAIALFPVINNSKKTPDGIECTNPNGLVQTTIRAIKNEFPELIVITDIALDPYTTHGQDGIINDSNYVLNDETIEMLVRQALSHAAAGADIIAPSDMMDGRIGKIRGALEDANFKDVLILSYAAKFASGFYGPFRDAVGSSKNLGEADKSTYQIATSNSDEALREVGFDIQEGADFVMIKPALPYLDIVKRVKETYKIPTFAYQVSGEYAMIKAAANNGWLNEKDVVLESLLSIKRSGANGIFSYFALDAAKWIKDCE
ncbi:MAG: porphobilinogen synthase [Gammaproteobacteria bacterium]|nr:porphobilinogen synthase [Gammaproteobacteria bacterium]|tara:strand:- start:687 stop:1700 length:1014 start_codon:yes stop_codon:yes gene_type:complete